MESGKPVVAEEFGHLVRDYDESLTGTTQLLKSLVGQVSGFQIWTFGGKEETRDYGPITTKLALSEWGRQWKKLAEPGGAIADYPRGRVPARTVVKLDRLPGLAPVQETAGEKIVRCWDAYVHPVDFDWPGNPVIARYREDGTVKI